MGVNFVVPHPMINKQIFFDLITQIFTVGWGGAYLVYLAPNKKDYAYEKSLVDQ